MTQVVTEGESPTVVQAEQQRPVVSLKSLTIRGSVWTISAYGVGQVLRLGSNLVLARLLFPEASGPAR